MGYPHHTSRKSSHTQKYTYVHIASFSCHTYYTANEIRPKKVFFAQIKNYSGQIRPKNPVSIFYIGFALSDPFFRQFTLNKKLFMFLPQNAP